jgi:dipeptidyl aminopeptidase/acylaminoacyl peptidase
MASIARYGEWSSPVITKLLVADSVRLGGIALDGGRAYWLEGRPSEGGRNVLVCRHADGVTRDVVSPPYNVRSRAHEYGGGAFHVDGGRTWFVNFDDQRIYEIGTAGPRPLTAIGPWRYADMILDADRGRLVCVREEHAGDGREPVNALVAVDTTSGAVRVLAEGHDFYASPCLSADGRRLAWITWDHPDMPWDAGTLWLAELAADGTLESPQRIAGGNGESVFQPLFRDDGALFFVSDPEGWWNLHRWRDGEVCCVLPMQAEFGRPQWQFGMSTYGFDSAGGIICCYSREGFWHLARLDADGGDLKAVETGFTDIQAIAVEGDRALIIGGAATRTAAVATVDATSGATIVLRESASRAFGEGYVSVPEAIDFPTGDGEHAHAFYYPPRNQDCRAPDDEQPPLIVIGHGGPTGATSATLSLPIQFWTSRGFAVLDVNYRGSTGYGRAYRERLAGCWGIADVEDCINGARYLAGTGRADGARLIIRGSSAGGYTTLAALTFHDDFAAGASYYGISDLETLATDTHKFESRYLDRLIGAYPQERDRYVARSPIHAVDRLSCPVIFFQGLEDKVVPPSQAERMVEALRSKGLPVAYLAFEGEQHGFRKAYTIERTLQAELCFYARVFGFTPADDLPELVIDNLRP